MSGRKPNAADVAVARQLREGGWSYPDIHRLLTVERGVKVHRHTLRYWCDEGARRRHHESDVRRKAERAAQRNGGRLISNASTVQFKSVRARALAGLGLDVELVARVIDFDLRDGTTVEDVRGWLA